MKRREFITLLGGAAAAWPLAARAQQASGCGASACSSASRGRSGSRLELAAFRAGLAAIGLDRGRNVRIEYRWGAGDADRIDSYCGGIGRAQRQTSFLSTARDALAALQAATRTIPIVFTQCRRSGRRRLCREPGAAGRQYHGFHAFESAIERQNGWNCSRRLRPTSRALPSFAIPPSRLASANSRAIQAVAPSLRAST